MSSFLEDFVGGLGAEPVLGFTYVKKKVQIISDIFSSSMVTTTCGDGEAEMECRDQRAAFQLKMAAMCIILFASIAGVALPLLGRRQRLLRTDGNVFFVAKAFAAGVILATGFVHMLPDSSTALTDPCLPSVFSKFPFSGFVAMFASLITLVVDFVATQYYERKHEKEEGARVSTVMEDGEVVVVGTEEEGNGVGEKRVGDFGEKNGMHIVGMHAHAAAHRHSHPHGHHSCEDTTHEHTRKLVGHAHTHSGHEDVESNVRHVVVSQVLEVGIVSHSMIIGLSVGVSQSPCTIRPLIAALSFHQFFEGFALGGCISQAEFKRLSTSLMASFFSITTPVGIGIGTAISSVYNTNSPRALVVEGIFDAISAGILVYMALVDLIAADFLSKRMSCNTRLQVCSYLALFLGATLMSLLAIWA
ncbi:zinc transporter 4, chloroplastic isoform X1 [Amborella trichopoda]|uniref:Uncharacterized protein n=2 Tax=Amborella trichopoda TaxID=13333 RepID=U5D4L1_AMBTC|nr:zinc transporter 4, chloroplastic isoform X1 [Amborella trichopoda]XP_020528868.1 zinc transporter 4, chloroplastic isoform X1 [Amborella trichopoda]ERN15298.1 hypothetical protein AMTR_s00036p00051770 [Amborella trichopoda]|eukprot:XP_020528867.1 zinc transporter 4, chloroplastic isoform X1 [Amborella trichopoda]